MIGLTQKRAWQWLYQTVGDGTDTTLDYNAALSRNPSSPVTATITLKHCLSREKSCEAKGAVMPDFGSLTKDTKEVFDLGPPLRRSAYSDRTAWLMAILAELAYVKFEDISNVHLQNLATELVEAARAGDTKDVTARLFAMNDLLSRSRNNTSGGTAANTEKARLETVLKIGGFELVGTFYNPDIRNFMANTEGYVAKRNVPGRTDNMAVIVFRGTTSVADWLTNIKAKPQSIPGQITKKKSHPGFWDAYEVVRADVNQLLEKVQDLPLFICGHSLGGALATIATYELQRDKLAACYTFGAPRVFNEAAAQDFVTPIYRIVNEFDPVAIVPPSDGVMSFWKFSFNALSRLGLAIVFERIAKAFKDHQGYRHVGDLRLLGKIVEHPQTGKKTVAFRTIFEIGDRLSRLTKLVSTVDWSNPFGYYARVKKLVGYHSMDQYRAKLRIRAINRQ